MQHQHYSTPELLSSDDWERLKELRHGFLNDASQNYWKTYRDLELYDLTYAQRIGWKWSAVLESLVIAGWHPCAKSIVDWGCGTGIASEVVSAWSGIDQVTLIDQSRLALSFAEKKLQKQKIEVSFAQQKKREPSDTLFLLSHVLGELCEEEAFELAREAAKADEVIWVEPGSHATSRNLSSLRNLFIEKGHHLIAPCLHQHLCPMLAENKEQEWCHFFAKPPTEIFQSAFWHEASRKLSIDLRSLPYSYFACSRNWKPSSQENDERLIGNPFVLKARCKLLCCGNSGLSEYVIQKRDQPQLFRDLVKKGRRGLFNFYSNNTT